jgi:hypothetical protein
MAETEKHEIFVPKQTDWQISFPKENQLLVEWKSLPNGMLKAEIPAKGVTFPVTLTFSDPICALTSDARVKPLDQKTFLLSEIGDMLTLEAKPDSAQPLPFAWLKGDFAVLSKDGWREFDGKQVSCDGSFLLDGDEEAKRLTSGELVAQGLPFFGDLLTAEKTFVLAEDFCGSISFERLSAMATRVLVDGREIGWWWKGHDPFVSLSAGEHTLTVFAAPSTYNTYGPHHYYLGDCRLTSPDTFFGRGGYTDNADAPANTFIESMQFVKFEIDGDLLFWKK